MNKIMKLILGVGLTFSLANASSYKLDKTHTEVGFSVKHLMITNVKGDFSEFDANIDFDNKTKMFNKFMATAKIDSINTKNTKRDKHLKSSDFFFAEKYPKMTFKMKSYKIDGDEGIMLGDLTIRGTTKEVKLNVEDLGTIKDFKGNNRVGFTLKGKINRMDFGLKWNKTLEFGGVAVSENVKIIVEIEAVEK